MTTLAYSFTKLVVSDLAASQRFYTEVLGLKLITNTTAPDGEYAQEEAIMSVTGKPDSAMLLLIRYLKRPAPPVGECWLGFIVADIQASTSAVEKAGGKVVVPIMDVPDQGLKAVVVADPEGHMIELVQMLQAA